MQKEITEAPGYYITDNGEVFNSIGVKLKPNKLINGYLRIEMRNKGLKVKVRLHRLVAQYFIPNPENKPQVNHLDGNKDNNNYLNLQWCTNQENMIHAVKAGLTNYSGIKSKAKYNGLQPFKRVRQLDLSGKIINRFSTVKEAKRTTGIQISGALSGRYKTAGGYIWQYDN